MGAPIPVNMDNLGYLLNNFFICHNTSKPTGVEFINFFDGVDVQNALQDFVKLPSQNTCIDNLLERSILSGLPSDYAKCDLGTENETVRDILGILYKHSQLQPEDTNKFHTAFDALVKSKDRLPDEEKLSSELTYLFKKYSKFAITEFVHQYIEKCRIASQYQNNTLGKIISDNDIFTKDIMACLDVITPILKSMQEPNQSWATIFANGVNLKNIFLGISKTMYFHDFAKDNQFFPTTPSTTTPLKNTSFVPETQQPNLRKPDISIPERNGSIHIYNTANGGSGGSAIVNNNTPASDSNTAMLLTPLLNKFDDLVEKLINSPWVRVQNGGQDKFSEHVDSVVQYATHPLSHTEVLQHSPVLQTVGMSYTQRSEIVADLISQRNIKYGEVNIAEQKMSDIKDIHISELAERKTVLASNETNQNSQNVFTDETTQLAPGASSFLSEINTSQNLQDKLQDRNITGVDSEVSLVKVSSDSNSNIAMSTHRMFYLAPNTEVLNNEQHYHDENLSNIGIINRDRTENDSQQVKIFNSTSAEFQPVRHEVQKLKFNVKMNQTPIHTTNRTIDPFSRRAVDLKKSFQFIKPVESSEKKESQGVILDNDLVSIV